MKRITRLFSSGRLFAFNLALVSLIVGFAAASLLSFSCSTGIPGEGNTVYAQDSTVSTAAVQPLLDLQNSFREVARIALPVVVKIDVKEVRTVTVPSSPFDFFNPAPRGQNPPQQREQEIPSTGSGVIVRQDGDTVYVATNNHVVAGANTIEIVLFDGRSFDAELVGRDERTDLAVVSFQSKERLPVIRLGDSEALQVGDWVLAVGSPFGFESTVTAGIVSATGRRPGAGTSITTDFTDYIQTDAAINPGNSGGALVNLRGELIGINTWIASQTGGYAGLGFAVPVNKAKKAIDDFIEHGQAIYGWLGVQIIEPANYPGLAEDLGVPEDAGAMVQSIFRKSPADTSGIRPGDVVIRIGDEEIRDSSHLTQIVGGRPPGTVLDFTVIRAGREQTLRVKLDKRESEANISNARATVWPGVVGFPVRADTNETLKSMGMDGDLDLPPSSEGYIVAFVERDSPMAAAGVLPFDIITAVGDEPIKGAQSFYGVLGDARSRARSRSIELTVRRGGEEVSLTVEP